MSRAARLVNAGLVFHVTARGNYRQDIFTQAEHRSVYLQLLARHAKSEGLRLWGWCLMTNHVHLLAGPEREDSLARAMQRTQGDYSRFFNGAQRSRSGHLWQGRFYSCPLNGDAVWTALRYIERNPVRAGIVADAEASSWSSAVFHCGLQPPPAFLDLGEWQKCWNADRWRSVLALGEDERMVESLREATQRGFPVGTPEFVDGLSRQVNRDFKIRPVGRPRVSQSSQVDRAVELAQGNTQ